MKFFLNGHLIKITNIYAEKKFLLTQKKIIKYGYSNFELLILNLYPLREEQFDPKLYESNNTEKIFQQAILDFKNISSEQITLSSTFEQTENDDTTNKNSNPHKRRKK